MYELNVLERIRVWWITGKRAKYLKIILVDGEFITALLDKNGKQI